MMDGELIKPRWDTSKDQQVSFSIDIGVVPQGYPGAGQYIVTVQAWPIMDRKSAERIEAAMREALEARFGIRLEKQGVG